MRKRMNKDQIQVGQEVWYYRVHSQRSLGRVPAEVVKVHPSRVTIEYQCRGVDILRHVEPEALEPREEGMSE
jgi:hypothetical protein